MNRINYPSAISNNELRIAIQYNQQTGVDWDCVRLSWGINRIVLGYRVESVLYTDDYRLIFAAYVEIMATTPGDL